MNTLKSVLAQEDTVLFVGSGLSRWSGLPSWPQLIEELATFVEASGSNANLVRAEASNGDLLQAAGYGFHKLTKQQIAEFMRQACRCGIAKPKEVHRKLVCLGPRCYITTNYDNLIEESLRLWRPDRPFRAPVTNRHLTELAEIVHARATNFVFKPHGDTADSESIILTREQYRNLLPGGERQAVLESLKLLLVSRPVVYVGFGLRDPDFMYVRDLLLNIYKGGTRDHYAIMADVLEAEAEYWRTKYGIHLISYQTTERPDKSRDHSKLLKLFDELLVSTSQATAPFSPCSPDTVLALARHAARLTRAPKCDPEFPIRVHLDASKPAKGQAYSWPDKFDHSPVSRFLEDGPPRAILIGLPGAGKSYALRRAAASLAETLHETCLSENFDHTAVTVPLLADFKLYHGDLYDLINRTLPTGLALENLNRCFTVKIFLDSFNEMPREYWDSGSYEADFSLFIANTPNVRFVVGSRTSDGLAKLGFPVYCLDEIDGSFVGRELERLGIDLGGRFEREIHWLLQKPFYFQLVANRTVSLPAQAQPRDLYETFFRRLATSFCARFGAVFNLQRALALAAYDAIDGGEEAQLLANVLGIFRKQMAEAGISDIDASDVANWLVSQGILIPYQGGRVAFFHQSATEYLAASELARRFQLNACTLKEKLNLTRWDQTVLLTISLLPSDVGSEFLRMIVDCDLALALNATKYLEFERDGIVAKLLSEIPSRLSEFGPPYWKVESALLFGVAVSEVHEPQLRALMSCRNSIGGAAVIRLVELRGESVKAELLQELVKARDDYNYCCNGIGAALRPFASIDDIRTVVALADSMKDEICPDSGDDVATGFISGAARFLSELDVLPVREALMPNDKSEPMPEIRSRILCAFLHEKHSTDALELAGDLLSRGVNEAATAIYFISNFAKPEDHLSWASFSSEHVERLVSMFLCEEEESWSVKALKRLCAARSDLAEFLVARAKTAYGISKAVLLYCASSGGPSGMFEALAELLKMDGDARNTKCTHLLKQIELCWEGHESLFVDLLRLRDTELALALLDEVYCRVDKPLGEIDVGPIDWWLEWLMEERATESGLWFCYQLSWLFGRVLNTSVRQAFVSEFNRAGSRFRGVLADLVLPHFSDLTTDALSEDAISFLMAELNRTGRSGAFGEQFLGLTATEQFVKDRLLPLLMTAKPPLSENLRRVLIQAGSRHGRRYIVT